ncbi:MAG: class I SAM-dependent methyltransferase, partial [Burkholderiales bacterium]|nr:class I SAM-dependent methyltransferase [Burkholderiales bacterium]
KRKVKPTDSLIAAFHQYRMGQAQRARILGSLLLQFGPDFQLSLRRAPDVAQACREAYADGSEGANEAIAHGFIAPLRELQGIIGAHEWRKNGILVPALGEKIHAHYSVFSPVRGEYCELVGNAPLPANCKTAFDIGTGTGILAAILAKRGVPQIIATDNQPRALACAQENMSRLGLAKQVQLQQADLFPAGKADLIVCNPPWLPGKPGSSMEHAIYDQDSRMLRHFLQGVAAHLQPTGEAWLILSDLAEHIGLRSRVQLMDWITQAGLVLLDKHDIKPQHGRAQDANDVLHAARSKEVTSLWRLAAKK